MKFKTLLLIVLAAGCAFNAVEAQQLPRKVRNVELQDLDGKKTKLPWWGEKNLLIFYVDPDKAKQNHEFTVELETNHRAAGPNIEGFGIINLKDSWYPVPNSTIRSMAKKRTAKNGATILCDPDHWFSSAWRLGDCNDAFVLIIVSKEGELVYVHKGELSQADIDEFYKVIDKYR
ncbi:MAG: YtfJ family protein [Alistipes sp.]|nr:YtfJ family protein [Alistipes sp.]